MLEGSATRANTLEGCWEREFPACSPEHLFEIASDIEAYPRFVPGCLATRILKKGAGKVWLVDNIFGFGPIRARFTTRATLEPPRQLTIVSGDWPWRDFFLSWTFSEENGRSRVTCRFAVEFRSALLNQMARLCVPEIERQVLCAFEKRVATIGRRSR